MTPQGEMAFGIMASLAQFGEFPYQRVRQGEDATRKAAEEARGRDWGHGMEC